MMGTELIYTELLHGLFEENLPPRESISTSWNHFADTSAVEIVMLDGDEQRARLLQALHIELIDVCLSRPKAQLGLPWHASRARVDKAADGLSLRALKLVCRSIQDMEARMAGGGSA